MVFDPTVPEINESAFEQKGWTASEFFTSKFKRLNPLTCLKQDERVLLSVPRLTQIMPVTVSLGD